MSRCMNCLFLLDDAVRREPHGICLCDECFHAEPCLVGDDGEVVA